MPQEVVSLARVSLNTEVSNVPLSIKGEIPNWLNGTLVRNGPDKFEAGGHKVAHWFDGLGMLHAFSFNQGKVIYTNRFLRSEAYTQVFEHQSVNYLGFDSDPCRSLFKRFFAFFFPDKNAIHNANINVSKYADAYVALTEIPLPVEFDLHTLDTKGVFHFADHLPQANCWESAHPHVDGNKKETINYILKYGREGTYIVYKLPKGSSTRKVIAEVPVRYPSYMHSFSVTENYVILSQYPLVINPLDILIKNLPFIQNYHWKEALGTTFLVIDKSTGHVVKELKAPAFFAFHHVNAFEKGKEIVIDIVSYPDAKIIDALAHYGYSMPSNVFPLPKLKRYALNMLTGKVEITPLSEYSFELPRINSDYDGKSYQFVYGADLSEMFSLNETRCIYKLNVNTLECLSWSEPGCCPGEPVFVKKNGGEDNGVVLCVVLDNKSRKSFLLVLDAATFKEIGRAETPHHIPEGLHGQYFG